VTLALHGIGVDAGIGTAIGRVVMLARGNIQVEPRMLDHGNVEQEVERFLHAVEAAATQLREIRSQIPEETPADILEFIDTHLLMLEDKAISEAPVQLIRDEGCSAEWALQLRRNQLIKVFEEMEDAYLRTRRDDLDHVVNRIMGILVGERKEDPWDIKGHIIVSEDLTPADTILLHHQGAAGLVTEFGSPMSHTAILARSLGVPAVVAAHGATRLLRPGETVVLDAGNGAVLSECDDATLQFFRRQLLREQAHRHSLQALKHAPAVTRDGEQITLWANIELPEDIDTVRKSGALGIGLYRTEFLYMNRENLPDEEEHFQAYLAVVKGLAGHPVTIRTLDLGADKQCAHHPEPAACINPALGLRAIRLCLKETAIFRTQIRAILRASAAGDVRLMLPMLTNVWEAQHARALIDDEIHNLLGAGVPINPHIPIGAMIETPAAAITAEHFARLFDFLSIGTNDLIQYTLAVDRSDDSVAHLYDPLHPAVLQLIDRIVQACRQEDKPVSICGEMAGDPRYLPVVLALGLKALSMQPASLLEAKQRIRRLYWWKLRRQSAQLLQASDPTQIQRQVEGLGGE
jgi:phosphotransferase system enzyme I (PtsI)